MKPVKLSIALMVLFIVFTAAVGVSSAQTGISISFDYERQSGIASNQFAVWIEDGRGRHVRTLFVTDFSARERGIKRRPDTVPVWAALSGAGKWPQKNVDAVSRATPASSRIGVFWDFTDHQGKMVRAGLYRYRVEGVVKWKKRILYSGDIKYGRKITITRPAVKAFPEGEKFEQNMITNVRIEKAQRP